jgi:tetratricopeptide (TPR) repeat protein
MIGSVAIAASGWSAYRANVEILRAVVAYPRDANETVAGANASIALDPGRGDSWNYRGLGFQLRGQFALAAADFAAAAERLPYQSAYWINLSRSRLFQLQNGDFSGGGAAASIAAAEQAIAAEPRLSSPHRNYAEIALALGDPDRALIEASTALDLYTGDPFIDTVLGQAAVQLPDRERARRVLESAVAKKGTSATLWAALAQVQLASGNITAARTAALRALALDPSSADARRVLGATGP